MLCSKGGEKEDFMRGAGRKLRTAANGAQISAPSPLAARASAIRSRTCGRQRLAFLAASATGGARKLNPSEGGEGAPAPCTEISCFGKEDSNERNPSGVSFVFIQVAFALQRRGEGAPAPCADVAEVRGAEVKPAGGGLPSSVTAFNPLSPCHLPQGEG